jgi:NAD(P)-dependent dehydrogenase (short-subunit alcohol dehydrogenase family)
MTVPEFSGKVAIVTGAARGLGAAFARSLAQRGAKVALFDLLEKEAKAVASDIVASGGEAEAYAVDVANQAAFRSAVDKVAERFGGIDILINNAGLGTTEDTKGKSWLDWPQSALEKVFAVNMGGTFYGCQAVVPHMRKRGRGKIVNVSSATYWSPIAEAAHYVAAKGGVIGLTRALAKGLGKDAITVNVLVPGLTRTEHMNEHYPEAVFTQFRQSRSIQRDAAPADLVGAMIYLSSPASDFVTGQAFVVDGGHIFD